jgi:hypothetical protein
MTGGGFAFDSSRGAINYRPRDKKTAAASAAALVLTTNIQRISEDWSVTRPAKVSGLLPLYRKWRR